MQFRRRLDCLVTVNKIEIYRFMAKFALAVSFFLNYFKEII